MEPPDVTLRSIHRKLTYWTETIRRATAATRVVLVATTGSSFRLEASWVDKEGARHAHSKTFTPALVLADGPRRACEYARAFIGEILALRGVIP